MHTNIPWRTNTWTKLEHEDKECFMCCGLESDAIKLSIVTDPELHSLSSVSGLFPFSRSTAASMVGESFFVVSGL